MYFDNLQVTHTRGALLEETHYYPFGLTMSGISSKAANMTPNKTKYQQYELNIDFDINLYESFYRSHDPQLGRFWHVDPLASEFPNMSPYAAFNDNPIRFTDPTGAAPEDIIVNGSDNKKWTSKAPGKDVTINVPVALKEDKTINLGLQNLGKADHYAIGYTLDVSARAAVGSGASVSGNLSVVNFTNDKFGGYNYTYAGGAYTASLGVQEGASASIGVNFFIAVNTNDVLNDKNSSPETFAGATSSAGFSQDLKAVVGGGWNISGFSMSDWKGISFGVSVGVGETVNAGAVNGGQSTSTLLNNEVPTKDRSWADKAFNTAFPITSGVGTFIKKKI